MAPYATPYLTLVFPRPHWTTNPGDYASDFRATQGKKDSDWDFEVRADPPGTSVILH